MFYCGEGDGGPVFLGRESHMLVIGPPRCGKTTQIVVPNLNAAKSAVVVTSTKADLFSSSLAQRKAVGNVWLFDPSGSTQVPVGVRRLRYSPVAFADSFANALLLSRAMVRSAMTRGQGNLSFWEERAEATIAPALFGANLGGLTMSTVMDMIETKELEPLLALLVANDEMEAARSLASVIGSADRERSGVLSTAAGILSGFRMPEVLRQSEDPNFDPAAFVSSRDTIYVVAPATVQDVLSPLVVGLIWSIRDAAYQQAAKRHQVSVAAPEEPAVSLILDEMANIAPIYDLGSLLSEGASQGILVLGVLQDLSQARSRWSSASEGFITLFGNTVVFGGIADVRTLGEFSALSGEKLAMLPGTGFRRSVFSPFPISHSGSIRPLLSASEIAHTKRGEALLLRAATGFSRVRFHRSELQRSRVTPNSKGREIGT